MARSLQDSLWKLLPWSSTKLEKDVLKATAFDERLIPLYSRIAGAKGRWALLGDPTPKGRIRVPENYEYSAADTSWLPWIAVELDLMRYHEFIPNPIDLIRQGVYLNRVHGTPAAIKQAMKVLGYPGAVIDEYTSPTIHFPEYTVILPTAPDGPETIHKMYRFATSLQPMRSRFRRLVSGYDVRKFFLNGTKFGAGLLSDYSGINLDDVAPSKVGPTNLRVSVSRSFTALVSITPTTLADIDRLRTFSLRVTRNGPYPRIDRDFRFGGFYALSAIAGQPLPLPASAWVTDDNYLAAARSVRQPGDNANVYLNEYGEFVGVKPDPSILFPIPNKINAASLISSIPAEVDVALGSIRFTPPEASSLLPVVVTVASGTDIATVSGNTIKLLGKTGSVTLQASQAGNISYVAAKPVFVSFAVRKTQTITPFSLPSVVQLGVAPFTIGLPTSDSGLPVSVVVQSGPATLQGNRLTVTGVGAVKLVATQQGNSTYSAAPTVYGTFRVNGTDQTISSFNLADTTPMVGSTQTLPAITASSGLPVQITVDGPATLSQNVLTVTGGGIITITASQAGNNQYNPAQSVMKYLVVPLAFSKDAGALFANVNALSITNPMSVPLTVRVEGTVSDDVTFNGQVYLPDRYGYGGTEGTPLWRNNPVGHRNGPHTFTNTLTIAPKGTLNIGVINNGSKGWIAGTVIYSF
jgi:hypothetical protein